MRIYSNILTSHDLGAAIRAVNAHRLPPSSWDHSGRIGFEVLTTIPRPRLRAHGWNVLLYRIGSQRRFNSGTHGAGCEGAASWDDWGEFLAVLFQRDPKLRVGRNYDGFAQFHAATQNKFAKFSGWGESGILYDDAYGNPKVEIVTDGTCGRSWNNALGTSLTPAPSARCPYEYEHEAMGVTDAGH